MQRGFRIDNITCAYLPLRLDYAVQLEQMARPVNDGTPRRDVCRYAISPNVSDPESFCTQSDCWRLEIYADCSTVSAPPPFYKSCLLRIV